MVTRRKPKRKGANDTNVKLKPTTSARGEKELDLTAYGRATQFIGITLQHLGITRTMRDVQHRPEDLRSYLAAVEHDPPAEDGST